MTQADNMRAADVAECAAGGMTAEEALQSSILNSTRWGREVVEGDLLAIWGWRTQSVLASEADVWMLSFEGAERRKVHFARESIARLNALLERFVVLRCEVLAAHTRALRWLGWLGFVPETVKFYNDQAFLVMKRERM